LFRTISSGFSEIKIASYWRLKICLFICKLRN